MNPPRPGHAVRSPAAGGIPLSEGKGTLGDVSANVPPGWPQGVPPAGAPGWTDRAVGWLLDRCPADYRRYVGLRKNPLALAWLAQRHLAGEVAVLRQAYREVRVEVGPHVTPEALAEILLALEAEGLRLVADRRSAELLHEALSGKVFVPRL